MQSSLFGVIRGLLPHSRVLLPGGASKYLLPVTTRAAPGRSCRARGHALITVQSIQRSHVPIRRAAADRAAPSTPRLMSAARVGPVVYGLLPTFRGDGG